MAGPGPARAPEGAPRGLEAVDVVKRYAGVPALKGVSMRLPPGQVVGLVGHNGAGKSTLLKTLSGAVRPDEGHLRVDGRPIGLGSPSDAIAAGISTVYQELSLLPNLTVTQNVFLGKELRRGLVLDRGRMRTRAVELVERFGLAVDVDRPLGSYPVATRQLLEIAVATSRQTRYLLLDEPTTSLEGGQIERLLELLGSLAADGLAILLVDHKLEELDRVANRLVVLVDGEVRIDDRAERVSRTAVVQAITGEQDVDHSLEAGKDGGEADRSLGDEFSLEVSHLRGKQLRDVTVRARTGRVLGIYGLVGSGRTELLRTLVGVDPMTSGEIRVEGSRYWPRDPRAAADAGLVYLTEERKVDGIVPQLDAVLNVALPVLDRYTRFGVLDRPALRQDAHQLLDGLSLRGDPGAAVVSLSGGNQQKVLLARALAQRPRILLLDEPTKGVDIGVKVEIHRIMRMLSHEQDLTVVLVSSEAEEILEVADDVAVFESGACDGTVRPAHELSLADLRQQAWTAA